jgi:hypothetical protein
MHKVALPVLVLSLLSASAGAASPAYQAGYRVGEQVGRAIGQALPFLIAGVLLLAAWIGYRLWSKRRVRTRSRLQ